MSNRFAILAATLLISDVSASAQASAQDAEPTFSGIVSHVSTTSVDVTDVASKETLDFLIVPTDGYGVVSADGKTTYQMAAIAVGWDLKITFSTNAGGQRHADHIVMLR
jgi:hypothetical protein